MALAVSTLFTMVLASSCLICPSESWKELRDRPADEGTYIKSSGWSGSRIVDPSRVLQLSWHPRVFHYTGFLSEEECDHLISLGAQDGNIETSHTGSDIVARIEERISAWTFLPRELGKPLHLRYYRSEKPQEKLDYLGNGLQSGPSLPLLAMVILFLNNVTHGGEILFPNSEAKNKISSGCTNTGSILKPVKGNAVLLFFRHLNTSLDRSSSHARCPVTEGDMWFAAKLFHTKRIENTRMSVESEDPDCTDEDENCSLWAKLGECQRNPVYMIGSPDYLGTCRKSCNVC